MARNRGTFCADELKRGLQLEGVAPRFLRPPQQLGKLHHGEKLLLLLLGSGEGKGKSVPTPPFLIPKKSSFLCNKPPLKDPNVSMAVWPSTEKLIKTHVLSIYTVL